VHVGINWPWVRRHDADHDANHDHGTAEDAPAVAVEIAAIMSGAES
jgi:hypothetical protein